MQRVFRLRLIEGVPTFRDQIYQHSRNLEQVAEKDTAAILNEFANASILALEHLKGDIDGKQLQEAVHMMDNANNIYAIGQRRAFPVASYLAYGLTPARIPLPSAGFGRRNVTPAGRIIESQ